MCCIFRIPSKKYKRFSFFIIWNFVFIIILSVKMLLCHVSDVSYPLLLAFVVGGLGFEFCVFVAGWRHALRSEWLW